MTFPTNIPAVTVWEKDISGRAPTYIRHEYGASYWEDNQGQTNGRTEDNGIFLAIPIGSMTDGYLPKKDDKLLAGSSVQSAPPQGALTVMRVKDFRYGSQMMRHIEVTAS